MPHLSRIGRSGLTLAAAWIFTRLYLLGALTGLVPYPDGPSLLSDVRLYAEWSELLVSGRFPVGDDMWQYPPGAGAVFAAAGLIGSNPLVGFLVLAAAADALALAVLWLAGRRRSTVRPAWVWVGSAVLIGPVFLARFDVFPTLAAIAALVWISRPVLSGAMAALGAVLKVWPAFVLLALPRRDLLRGGAAFAVTAAATTAAVMLWASGSVSFLGEQQSRGLQVESVGALPYVVLGALGEPMRTTFRFGSMEVDMPGATALGVVIALLGFALLAGLLILRLSGRLERVPPGDVALTALLISVATSRVISPQYAVWVAGVAAAALLDPRCRMRTVTALLAGWALCGQVIYPAAYGDMLSGAWPAVVVETLRTVALVAATGIALAHVLRGALSRTPAAAPHAGTLPVSGALAPDQAQGRDEPGVGKDSQGDPVIVRELLRRPQEDGDDTAAADRTV